MADLPPMDRLRPNFLASRLYCHAHAKTQINEPAREGKQDLLDVGQFGHGARSGWGFKCLARPTGRVGYARGLKGVVVRG